MREGKHEERNVPKQAARASRRTTNEKQNITHTHSDDDQKKKQVETAVIKKHSPDMVGSKVSQIAEQICRKSSPPRGSARWPPRRQTPCYPRECPPAPRGTRRSTCERRSSAGVSGTCLPVSPGRLGRRSAARTSTSSRPAVAAATWGGSKYQHTQLSLNGGAFVYSSAPVQCLS